jgi:cation diffusion facilitator CzcD-associated flavoprotein CzcO
MVSNKPATDLRDAQNKPGVSRKFAIIGAGAAGLCAAKYLKEAGFDDVTIFEIGTKIGGLWCYENDSGLSSAYATLHINTPKSVTSFSDLPFRDDVQVFPDHLDMYEYFVSYAARFDLVKHIRFKSRVVSVRPEERFNPKAPKWLLTTEHGETQVFDRIIVANGHLTVPRHVAEFQEKFAGEYVHTHYYRSPDKFVGRRVCIIGSGNSACDVASDICMTAANTVLVARSGVIIVPKLVFGVPFHDVRLWLERHWVPQRLRTRLERFLTYALQGSMAELGFKPLKKRVHGTSNALLVQHIKYNRVTVKQGIKKIEGNRIKFSDGTSDEFDVLIAGTGYRIDFPFLPESVSPIRGSSIDLYKRVVSPDWSGIYFIGLANTNTSAMQLFEHQMRWLLPHELGNALYPTAEIMRKDIEARKEQLRRTFQESPRHAVEEPYQDYFPALKESLREAIARMRKAVRTKGKDLSSFENYEARPTSQPVHEKRSVANEEQLPGKA